MHQPSSNNQRALVVHNNVGATQRNLTGLSYAPRQFETGEELIMLVPRTSAAASSIFHTSVIECNKIYPRTPYQRAAFYLSALSGIFPGLLPLAKEVLQDMGYSVREVTEDTAVENGIELKSWINGSTLFGVFGQLVLILYMNTDDPFEEVLVSRVSAIKNLAGMAGYLVRGAAGDTLLPYSVAREIRTIVGGSSRICAALLNMIRANRDGESRLNSVCNYLADLPLQVQTVRATLR